MTDQICSPEKYRMKNSYIKKKIVYLNEKIYVYDKKYFLLKKN